jgi:GH25 family lysozyme M1 (1,4-beta-N-acetylmuramidase)
MLDTLLGAAIHYSQSASCFQRRAVPFSRTSSQAQLGQKDRYPTWEIFVKRISSAAVTLIFPTFALAQSTPTPYDPLIEEPSRQELFYAEKVLEGGPVEYSATPNFSFPDGVTKDHLFGIDISANNESNCHCSINWKEITGYNVSFVYLRASAGDKYKDPTYLTSMLALRPLLTDKVRVGAYHFFRANPDPEIQADNFLSVAGKIELSDLSPSLDLEWDPGPMTDDCPQNARVPQRSSDGKIINRCDRWYSFSSKEIIDRANRWIDRIKKITGRDVIVYTNNYWWQSRIGSKEALDKLHSKLIWTSFYPKDWPTDQLPKFPDARYWALWQFTQLGGIRSDGKVLIVDASMSPFGAESNK